MIAGLLLAVVGFGLYRLGLARGHANGLRQAGPALLEASDAVGAAIRDLQRLQDPEHGFEPFAAAQLATGAECIVAVIVRTEGDVRRYKVRRMTRPDVDIPPERIVTALATHYHRTRREIAEA